MNFDIRAGTVRVLTSDGGTAGTGFVVSADGLMVTSSRVVHGPRAQSNGEPQLQSVTVEFFNRERREAVLFDSGSRPGDSEDIAVLRIKGDLPPLVAPLPIGKSNGTNGHRFETCGFPDLDRVEALHAYGEVGGEVHRLGLFNYLMLTESGGVACGFRGAPVWDINTSRAIGMVDSFPNEDEFGQLKDRTFVMPSEVIRQVCPELPFVETCPYRPLQVFTEGDADLFFGRDAIAQRVADRFTSDSFVVVLGPSGCGKSSLIRAGVIPRLCTGEGNGADSYKILITRPNQDPPIDLERQGLAGAAGGLFHAVESWCIANSAPGGPGSRLILVFDQFEEVLIAEPAPRIRLFNELKSILEQDLWPVTVVLVMWDAFYSRLLETAPFLNDWLEFGTINIPPTLFPYDVEAMITNPAEVVGIDVEPDVIRVILRDLAEVDGRGGEIEIHNTVLPLLQLALADLWTRKQDGVLAIEDYRGIKNALTNWIDSVCREFREHDREFPDQELMPYVRRIFIDLVEPGIVAKGIPDCRRRKPLEELYRDSDGQAERAAVDHVVTRLTLARILVIFRAEDGRESIEIIHDAVVTGWAELRGWLEEHRLLLDRRLSNQDRVTQWAPRITQNSQIVADEGLLRGNELAEIESWIAEYDPLLSGRERAFLMPSQDLKTPNVKRRRRRVLVLLSLLVLTMVGGVAAAWQLARAREIVVETKARLVRSAVADGSDHVNRSDTTRALASFAQALKIGNEEPDQVVILFRRIKTLFGLKVDDEILNQVQNNRRRIREILRSHPRVNLVLYHDAAVSYAEFSPDPDSQFILTFAGPKLRLWNAVDGSLRNEWVHPCEVRFASFAPKGEVILSVAADNVVRIWSAGSDTPVHELRGAGYGVYARASFDPQADRVILLADRISDGSGVSTALLVWKPSDGSLKELTQTPLATVMEVSPASSVAMAIIASGPVAQAWNLDDGKQVAEWRHNDTINSIAYSPDGKLVATGSHDSTIGVHELPSGTIRWSQSLYSGVSLFGLRFSQGGRFLFAQTSRGVSLLEAPTGRAGLADAKEAAQLLLPKGTLSADLRRRLEIKGDYSVRVVDLAGVYPADTLLVPTGGEIKTVLADAAGRVAMLSKNGDITAWDSAGKILFRATGPYQSAGLDPSGVLVLADAVSFHSIDLGKETKPTSVAFGNPTTSATSSLSLNGRFLAAIDCHGDHIIKVWDTNGRVQIGSLLPGADDHPFSAVLSPNGDRLVTIGFQIQDGITVPNSKVVLWDTRGGRSLKTLPTFPLAAQVSFSTDGGRFVLTSPREGIASVFASEDGRECATRFSHHGLQHAAISSNGLYLLTCGADKTCRVWDVATGDVVGEVNHSSAITHAAFNPDGCSFITAGADGVTHVWDLATFQPLDPGMINEGPVDEAWFTPDGNRTVSVTRANRGFHVSTVGDDPTWTTEDLILAAEFLSTSRVTSKGVIPLDRSRSEDAWNRLKANHPEILRSTRSQELQFSWKQALASQAAGKWDKAALHLEKLLADPLSRDSPAVHGSLAYVLVQLQRYPEAESHYREALTKEPRNTAYNGWLATALWQQGKFADAVDRYNRAIELHGGPEKAPGWIVANLGSALAALGRWENAIKSLEQGIENGGLADEMLAYRHLALSLLAAGRIGDYEALRLKLVQLYGATQNGTQAHDTARILLLRPFPPEIIMKPSRPMVTSKDVIDLAFRATLQYPNNGLYASTLGAALYRANRNLESPQFLRQAIETQEKNGQFDLPRERLYFAMAENARGRAGNWELARAEFDRAKEWLDKISATPPSPGGAATHPWDLLIEVGLLVKEAQQVTKTTSSAP